MRFKLAVHSEQIISVVSISVTRKDGLDMMTKYQTVSFKSSLYIFNCFLIAMC